MVYMVKVFVHILTALKKIKNWINSKKVVTADLYRLVVRLNKNSAGTKINPSSTLLKSFESDEP